jgi:hypothetical protein
VRVLTWLFRWKPWALGGAVLIALAQCPVANAEGDRARRVPIVTRPAAEAVEPVELVPVPALATAPPPSNPSNGVTDSMGGAVYNPFSEARQPHGRAKDAGERSTSTEEANPTTAIVAALACMAALGYLLRRALRGF